MAWSSAVSSIWEGVHNLVIVEKSDGSLRICLNPIDLNKAIKRKPNVLIPTVEEISEKLRNKSIFTVLDLKDGFWHVELDEKSSELCTFSTIFGSWKFNRLPFGVNMAPEYFQEVNEKNFGDIEGVIIYFVDICISAETEEEHDKILDQGGVQIDQERIRAIDAIENLKSKAEVQKILGTVNYVRKFIPNLSELTAPLRELLKDGVEFQWFESHSKALQEIKAALKNAPVLANFNANIEIFIQSDASKSSLGIEKTKSRARQLLYWPGLMSEIENMISKCTICERYRSLNSKEPLIVHDIPDIPFNKIACDICEFAGKNYLVIQDYYSKWLEMLEIKNKTASEVIINLKTVFATHGIPKIIVCDNQPFSSYEFNMFAQQWNFDITTSSPYYPRSNGQAERAVQVAKKLLKKCIDDNKELTVALLEYRNTPITGLVVSPAQIIFSRRTRTKLPIHSELLKPKVEPQAHQQIKKRQEIYKQYHDKNCRTKRDLNVDQLLPGRDFNRIINVEDSQNRLPNNNNVAEHRINRDVNDLPADEPEAQLRIENNANQNIGVTRTGRIIKEPVRFKDYYRFELQ
ncbi:uncharacterized protein K02A2.6-like [Leptopilina heterotoma]|uniref:uncharacterized protein K02A2.6-like n=1 Tax=Leptopilina heterotoma TaxID=63436 RepID=UPI001CA8058B|nr:uncharacterized protein K02A2.6-like [Leptopilina heterotoma]